MALQVIGAGFGRTGTLSLKHALERLGYTKTHHMHEVLRSRRQVRLWHEIGRGADPHWDEVFEGFAASVDFPSSTYYRELLDHYPEAKVVLTVRDIDRWYDSTAATIYRMRELTPVWLARVIPPARLMVEMTDATVWDRVFDGRFADEVRAKQAFGDYVDQVRATVPAERLLVFEVAQGWEPLCSFLGRAVPDEPFPHRNDARSFTFKLVAMRGLRAVPAVMAVGVLVSIGGLSRCRARRR